MRYEELIEQVQRRAELEPEVAASTVAITLETLGSRLPRPARQKVAAELPQGLATHLERRAGRAPLEQDPLHDGALRFSAEELVQRVAVRLGLGHPEARRRSRAVLSSLRLALSDGTWKALGSSLPGDYDHLLAPG